MKITLTILTSLMLLSGCEESSDDIQRRQQEVILKEGTSQVGMPSIKNFRERKLLKDIIEMRDQDGLSTYTYIVAEQTGKFVFVCDSIGFGIPAATQFTNPQKIDVSSGGHVAVLPQADPNGLFSPASADATWVMCLDPVKGKAVPQYIEPKVMVMTFKLP